MCLAPVTRLWPEAYAGMDFNAATREYDQTYDLMELFHTSKPGSEPEAESEDEDAPENNFLITEADLAEQPDGGQETGEMPNNRAQARCDLLSAAMTAQGGQIPLESNSTVRLRPCVGDYLLCIRCTDPWCEPPGLGVIDFWEFRRGDQLLITNREQDYPAPVEQMEQQNPSVWRVLAGDRLAWVGWRMHSNARQPTLVALINCLQEGYACGIPELLTLQSVMSFGAPSCEPTPEVRTLWMVGFDAAKALRLPRTWQPE